MNKPKNAVFTREFEKKYFYGGNDLGCRYTKKESEFCVWTPAADKVVINLYREGMGGTPQESFLMKKEEKGIWRFKVEQDIEGMYYTYSVTIGDSCEEAVDPYAKSAGVNGKRGMVLDLAKTNPKDWEKDTKPPYAAMADAIIYEAHIRDISSHASSGIRQKGKFLGLTEAETKNEKGLSTGINHMKELGITHLHLLPFFDYLSVNEEQTDKPQFNWGYDPQNYNVPEGSYATNPYDGDVRVRELKEMVRSIHDNGIRVVMDVVYNHTAQTMDSNFNKIVPDYYYRKKGEAFSNASACGNETASERRMVRKFIVDSVCYWASEYHIDGFRFDLMGVHDCTTMNEIRKAVNKIDKTIVLYGEGWTGGDSVLKEERRAVKANTYRMNGIASFSDDIRDDIKGHVFELREKGFVSGRDGLEESIQFSIAGAIEHPQTLSKKAWAKNPIQTINYVSAHDNLTLWDKLATSNPKDSEEVRKKMNKLAAAIVMTSQGIPFLQAGEEMLRSKPTGRKDEPFDENSYQSSDEVNGIRWDKKTENLDVFHYYQGLIAFRKEHSGLRMEFAKEVRKNLLFLEPQKRNVIAFSIQEKRPDGGKGHLLIYLNSNKKSVTVKLLEGVWNVYADENSAGTKAIKQIENSKIVLPPISAIVLADY